MLSLYSKTPSISKATKNLKGEVVKKGWIHRKRSSGSKMFIIIRDPSGILQCVVDKSVVKEKEWEEADRAYLESSIIIRGTIRKDERAPTGFEMEVKELRIVQSGEQFP